MAEWQEHCPLDDNPHNEDHPAERKAWRDGWLYCMKHGPGAPDSPPSRRADLFDRPALLSIWLRGYSAADKHLREEAQSAQH